MPNVKSKTKAVANIKKNRLHVAMSGNIDTKALEKLYTEIRFCVADLKEKFEVVSDISECNFIYVAGLPTYKKITDFLISKKVGAIVRVVKSDNISYKQIVNFSDRIHCYRTMYAEDQKEAENILETLIKRDGIRFQMNNAIIEYTINNEAGKGRLIDVSTSGCAVEAVAHALSVGVIIDLTLEFPPYQELLSVFQTKAEVVRTDDAIFAARFVALTDGYKEQLYQRLVSEVSRFSLVL